MTFQDRPRRRSGLWVDRGPAGEIARQDFEREQRGCNLREAIVGFLGAAGGRSLAQKLAKFEMGFDEGSELGLPQCIRQTTITVQIVIALDQASALNAEGLRQDTEVGAVRVGT